LDSVLLTEDPPTPTDYVALRALMGWGTIDEAVARRTLACSTYTACLRQEGRLLGLARVVGDGVLYFYISDVIVHPSLQGGGYGSTLMAAVMAYLRQAADPGATIAVLPLRGRETFYARFGFLTCPNEIFGAGMYLNPR